MTPRKTQPRHKHNSSQSHLQQVQASDYESEIPYNPPPPTRTNTALNLSVLQRYNPAITTILSIAASTELYAYSPSEQSWERAEIAGTLFVCQLRSIGNGEGYCVVVLNKKGLENLIIDVADMQDVEITTEFLIVRFREREEEKVLGFYIQPDKDDTRELNSKLIRECWEEVMEGSGRAQGNGDGLEQYLDEVMPGPEIGRRLSLTDLFGQQGMR